MPDTYDPAALRALATEVSAAAADILALRQPKYETRKRIAQFQREAPATVLALLDRVARLEAEREQWRAGYHERMAQRARAKNGRLLDERGELQAALYNAERERDALAARVAALLGVAAALEMTLEGLLVGATHDDACHSGTGAACNCGFEGARATALSALREAAALRGGAEGAADA